MKRIILSGVFILLCFSIFGGSITNAEPINSEDETKVELSDEQKKELDALFTDLLETRKAIINKYVEFGIFSQEKADKKLSWLDKHYTKMKENGYVPMKGAHKHKGENHKD
ncbi:YckD family protein [Fredinandcohnia quinoae]|uniref:YckD family protein n=1 Tax=Fredinandcohnia quinoae TaxID=2918902 RepID=A0AAW5EDH2_9BACI|nr:YckD family protein [Fredinandcohnia sp. SECRCQ15]MCH1626814.1 YckD family protein [Fredinandcohnia sp. SECRCQ15]